MRMVMCTPSQTVILCESGTDRSARTLSSNPLTHTRACDLITMRPNQCLMWSHRSTWVAQSYQCGVDEWRCDPRSSDLR